MFTTLLLNVRRVIIKPKPDRIVARQRFMRFAFAFTKRANRCYRLGIRKVIESFQNINRMRVVRKYATKELFNERIDIACREHGFEGSYVFQNSLKAMNIEIDRNMLQLLSIYEPRSFKSLVDIVKQQLIDTGFISSSIGPGSKVISRGLLNSPIVPGNRKYYM